MTFAGVSGGGMTCREHCLDWVLMPHLTSPHIISLHRKRDVADRLTLYSAASWRCQAMLSIFLGVVSAGLIMSCLTLAGKAGALLATAVLAAFCVSNIVSSGKEKP